MATIKPLNYCTEALPKLYDSALIALKQGDKEDAEWLDYIATCLFEGEKFHIPEQRLFSTNPSDITMFNEYFKLPFSKLIIELDHISTDKILQPYIICAVNMSDLEFEIVKGSLPIRVLDREDLIFISLLGICKIPYKQRLWIPYKWGIAIDTKSVKILDKDTLAIDVYDIPILPSLIDNIDTEQNEYSNALLDAAWTIADLCLFVNCNNTAPLIQKTTIGKAKKLLNKSRVKKGKAPYFNYHVINIYGPETQYRERGEPTGLHHSSPHMHSRRGHVRHLHEKHGGGITWVKPTIVGVGHGPKIEKHYEAKM